MSRNNTTEQPEAAALREGDELFRRVFEEGPLAIGLVDETYRLTHVNQRLCDLLGYTEEELTAMTFPEFAHPEDVEKDLELAGKLFGGEIPSYTREKRFVTKTGESVWVHLTATVIRDEEGVPLYGLGMAEEIEQRKRAEEQIWTLNADLGERIAGLETANKELEAFSATVSHDLKSPLLTITQFSQLLLEETEGELNEHQTDLLKRIRTAGLQAKHIIDDLRDLADVAHRELFPERIDLTALVREIVDEFSVLDDERVVVVDAQPDVHAMGDPVLVRVLLANLLQNAWKYSAPKDETRIEFGAEVGPLRTIFHIRDNGIGFDNAHRERIFRAFERLHTEDEFAGSGLGLATAQRIVARHGGEIWAKGEPGVGATLWFTLYGSAFGGLG